MFFDYSYVMYVMPAIFLSLYAQYKVSSTFNSFSRVQSSRGMTGAQAATALLQRSGLWDVNVERVRGNLTDHYDPRTKTLRLSDSVFDSTSIAAIGVAAHETGHAVQHEEGYIPLSTRNSIVPIANFASKLSMPLILLGFFFSYSAGLGYFLIELGIILFGAVVLFQVITLPVEFNASKRALLMTEDAGILTDHEVQGAKKVLNAAALTYVAATIVAIANLLRLLAIFGRRD